MITKLWTRIEIISSLWTWQDDLFASIFGACKDQMIHDAVMEWAMIRKSHFNIFSCDISTTSGDWVATIETSMCCFPRWNMPAWTSHLAWWVKSCCILDGSLSHSCRLKVKLTGHLWLSLWDTVDTVGNEGLSAKTIPHFFKENQWGSCTSSYLRFPCQPLFISICVIGGSN